MRHAWRTPDLLEHQEAGLADNRYTLQTIKDAWEGCTSCELGVRRKATGGKFVFGEGAPRGIMLIGEGPGENEEVEGRPFVGQSGMILRQVIDKLGLDGCCYVTNVVSCRSCSQAYNGEGQPVMRYDRATKTRVPFIKDDVPTPLQMASCLPRLFEEIYLVDPVVIVTLGAEAAKAIIPERSFSMVSERGKTREIDIPGAWHTPSLTDKKKAWLRRVRGQDVMPTVQRRVRYLVLPTLHPAYVLRRQADQSYKNPLDMFLLDLKQAALIYDDYLEKTFGTSRKEREVTINDLAEMNDA